VPDTSWFDGYESAGVPAWGPLFDGTPTEIHISVRPSKIEVGGITTVMARTTNLDYLGRTAILTIGSLTTAGAGWFTAVMEPDAEEGLIAIFEVVGLSVGPTALSVEVV
jgi:hypothetical protein